ncbi:hypothetical protein FHP29_05915 [Nocardioides albidus]|uniref:Uncharacterized protein n=1 Tax=Nocardioides albidus TaxID=1517589 RepID=A0A5C4W7Q7_9ACTN|nr:hypothetical protein [Nocardioides albidus]TNM44237.1 hypothetical protein FHP29_05915 [Nocardioides albidus]
MTVSAPTADSTPEVRARPLPPVQMLHCLPCGACTPHALGPQTLAPDGSVLVQWWRCTECAEGQTVTGCG